MDYQKFYLSPQGRVNRKQLWLYLVVPAVVTVLVVSVAFVAIVRIAVALGASGWLAAVVAAAKVQLRL